MNTVLEATYPCPIPHIEYKAVLLAQMHHVWSRNVGIICLLGKFWVKHTHTEQEQYIPARQERCS